MKVLSLNCWSGRVDGLADYLKKADADVYCLQEVMSAPPETPEWLHYEGQGSTPQSQKSKLFEELTEALGRHWGYFCPATQGYLHDGATTGYSARYGIATFVRRTVPVIESTQRFVFGEYRSMIWGEPPLPRTAHAIRVWDYKSDGPVVVAHMHGLWVPVGKTDTVDRYLQAQELAALANSVKHEGDRVVICGDFNVLPESATFRVLQEQAGVSDLVSRYGVTDTRTSFYKKAPRFADYMLVSDNVKPIKFDVPAQPEVSDHRPLVLDF
jgi:endonuclease/exonuclease/phosphatase family metal-dependent hydrolase